MAGGNNANSLSDGIHELPPGAPGLEHIPISPGLVRMEEEEGILHRKLMMFGTDVGTIPCFRNSFLYGITGGIGSGLVHFAIRSRVQNATRFGFWSYIGITVVYWCWCRYDFTMTKFRYTQLKYAMKESAYREGTAQAMPREKEDT